MTLSIIIPSFNEEKNLFHLLPELKAVLDSTAIEYEIITVDAKASEDNTEEICKIHSAHYIRQKKEGYGDAFRTGIAAAKNDLILVVDADNSQDISKIPEMYKAAAAGADVVIGSRYVKGGKTSDPPVNIFMSKVLNTAYSLILGLKQKDISTDFRIYNAEKLREITTVCKNFDIIEETLFLLKKSFPDINITEIPINYSQRREGRSKRRLIKFITDYIRLLVRLLKLKLRG